MIAIHRVWWRGRILWGFSSALDVVGVAACAALLAVYPLHYWSVAAVFLALSIVREVKMARDLARVLASLGCVPDPNEGRLTILAERARIAARIIFRSFLWPATMSAALISVAAILLQHHGRSIEP